MLQYTQIIVIILFFTFPVLAQKDTIPQNNDIDVMDADDILSGQKASDQTIVSASRSAKNINDLPFTAFIVTAEDIRRNGYTTLVDVLKSVPGIRVSQPGSSLEGETFLMRGLLGNYYTKILINSLPISPSVVSGMPIGEQLPIRQAERIEIIYGPSSAVYGGGDAMVGIINIITKTPENSVYAQADAVMGEYGYQHLNFMVSGKAGKNKDVLQYNVFGSQGQRDNVNIQHYTYKNVFDPLRYTGFSLISQQLGGPGGGNQPSITLNDITNAYPYYQGTLNTPVINQLPQKSHLLGIDLHFKGFRFTYMNMYRQDHSSIGLSPLSFSYADPERLYGETIQRTSLGYNNTFGKWTISTNLSYLNYRMNPRSSWSPNYDDNTNGRGFVYSASDDLFFEQIVNYNLNSKWEITAGFSFQYSGNLPFINYQSTAFNPSDYQPFSTEKKILNSTIGDFGYHPYTYTYAGGFLQGYYTRNRVSFISNIRFDAPSRYESRAFLRFAFLYKISQKSSFRASIGTSYRIPSGYYVYNSYAAAATATLPNGQQVSGIQYEIIPNEQLSPEQFSSFELGFHSKISKRIELDVNLYFNTLNQAINRSITALDSVKYKNSITQFDTSRVQARNFSNTGDTYSNLLGMQINLRMKNIIPSIKFNTDLYITLSTGEEKLPEDNGIINTIRQVPDAQIQWNISFSPFNKFFLNLNQVYCSSWYRRFIPVASILNFTEFTKTEGYYVADLTGSYDLSKNLTAYLKVRNLLNTQYAGIDATGTDQDLNYNPQLGRNIQFGLSFRLK